MAAGSPIFLSSPRPHHLAPLQAGRGIPGSAAGPHFLSDHPKALSPRPSNSAHGLPRPSYDALVAATNPNAAEHGNCRSARFSKGFLHKQPGLPVEPLRYSDNGLWKETFKEKGLDEARLLLGPDKADSFFEGRKKRLREQNYMAQRKQMEEAAVTQRAKERADRRVARIRHRHESQGASVIQEHYRRRQSRKQLEEEARSSDARARLAKEELARRQVMAHRIERRYYAWARLSEQRAKQQRSRAALRLQAFVRMRLSRTTYRGYVYKQHAKVVLHENQTFFDRMRAELRVASALKIQTIWRGYKCRKENADIAAYGRIFVMRVNIKVVMAAKKWQALWRGRKGRDKAAKRKRRKNARRHSDLTRLPSLRRGESSDDGRSRRNSWGASPRGQSGVTSPAFQHPGISRAQSMAGAPAASSSDASPKSPSPLGLRPRGVSRRQSGEELMRPSPLESRSRRGSKETGGFTKR